MGVFKAQNSFTAGIISPALWGRVDLPQYMTAAADIKNFLVRPWGGLTRRGGLYFGWEVKDATVETRLLPFRYSSGDTFVIEAGPNYFRFGRNGAVLQGVGGPVEIYTPYTDEQVPDLWITQSADAVWICHPDVPTRKLLRYSDVEWYLQPASFIDGPYLPVNSTDYTMVASAETGSVTVTAAGGPAITALGATVYFKYILGIPAPIPCMLVTTGSKHGLAPGESVTISGCTGTTEANGTWTVLEVVDDYNFKIPPFFVNPYLGGGTLSPELFVATDVGRLLRIWYDDGTDAFWSWGEITAVISAAQVQVQVVEGKFPDNTTAPIGPPTSQWRLGKYSDTTGYPALAVLHQQRIGYAGAPAAPLDLDFSQTDIIDWFQTNRELDIVATDAISYTLFSQQINPINWMIPMKHGLGVGTDGGLWLFAGSGQGVALSATELPVADEHSGVGASRIKPARTGSSALFVDFTKRRVHEFAYVFEEDGYQAPDMTLLAEHLTSSTTIKDIVWQDGERVLWVLLENGNLITLTYMREEKVVAWHRVETLGTFKGLVSIKEGGRDVVYAVVERQINGQAVRYVEYFGDIFRGTQISDGYFLDSGVSAQLAETVVSVDDISQASQARMTVAFPGSGAPLPATGQVVLVEDVGGMVEVNGNHYAVRKLWGLLYDLYDEMAVMAERVLYSEQDAYTPYGNNTVSHVTLVQTVLITYVDDAKGAAFDLGGPATAGALTDGETYKLVFNYDSTLTSSARFVVNSTIGGILAQSDTVTTAGGMVELVFTADAGDITFEMTGMAAGDELYISDGSLSLAEHDALLVVDSTGFTAYTTGGTASVERRYVNGLDHLEGETVLAVGDGKIIPEKVVTGGVVDLGQYVTSYQVGLPFASRVESLPIELNDQRSGSTIGRTKSVNRIIARISDSYYYRCGLIVDGSEQIIDEVLFTEDTVFGEQPALVTTEKDLYPEGTYGTDVRYVLETDLPAPLNISAVVVELNQEGE